MIHIATVRVPLPPAAELVARWLAADARVRALDAEDELLARELRSRKVQYCVHRPPRGPGAYIDVVIDGGRACLAFGKHWHPQTLAEAVEQEANRDIAPDCYRVAVQGRFVRRYCDVLRMTIGELIDEAIELHSDCRRHGGGRRMPSAVQFGGFTWVHDGHRWVCVGEPTVLSYEHADAALRMRYRRQAKSGT